MRRRLFSFLLLLMAGIVAVQAQAYDFSAVAPTGQTLYYKINSDSTTVKVVRPSNNWSGYAKPTGSLVIPAVVIDSTDTTAYVVKTIGDTAFASCTNLTNVVINDSITRIGHESFTGTQNLQNVTIGSSVTFIGNGAFRYARLSSVTIPESVAYLGLASFYMSSLVTVNFNARNCACAGSVGYNSNYSPFTFRTYGYYESFYSNKSIKTVNIGQSVQSIPAFLFRSCDSLRIVNFSDSINSIGQYAFYWCQKLSSLSLPNSITTIGQRAFANCSSIDSLIIPNSVTSIGQGAFACCYMSSVTLPNSITSIAGNTFTCCKLRSIVIPDSVTSIGDNAFSNCDSLRSVVIGASVTSIGQHVFYSCASMEHMTVLCSIPPNINTNHHSFGNASDGVPRSIPVYVPCNSIASYTSAAGWNGFTNIQEPADCTSHYWDFHQTTAEGSSVYYKILDDSVSVAVVHPLASDSIDGTYWHGYRRTAGQLVIPDTVVHDSLAYVVRVIGSNAFEGCTGISSVTIPSTIDSIGNSAFAGCTGIHTVYFNADSCHYMGEADSLVFGGIRWLHTLHIGNNVRSVPNYAFERLLGLQAIVIPDSVVSVGDWSFAYDANVTELTLGASLSHIGVGAFYGCGRLQRVVVPPTTPSTPGSTSGGWTWIGGGAFGGCSFGSFTYGGTTISSGLFSGNTSLDTVYISDTVTTIGDSAFNGCTSLTTVEGEGYTGIPEAWIPRTVRNVGNVAFGNCVALTRVRYDADSCLRMGCDTLPVFMNDSNVAELVIGEYVRWIPDYAFVGCTGVENITAYGMVAPVLGVDVFRDVADTIPVHIPCGSLASYTSRWSHFTNFVEDPMDDTIVVLTADSVMGSATVMTLPTCDNGRTAMVEATANYGYHFTAWNDGVTDNPRTLVVVCDTVLTALFDRNEYVLTVMCDSTQGTVTGAGVYLFGDTATVVVEPNEGFVFSHWEETGSTELMIDTVMNGDVTLTVLFDTVYYTLAVSSNNPEWGSVSGGGEYAYGSEVEITATPNEGYYFVRWSDGELDNPRVVFVMENMELTAEFAEGVGVEDVDGKAVAVYPNPTNGVVYIEGEGVSHVEVYDLGGHLVMSGEHVSKVDLSALPAKVYYVRVVHKHGITISKVVKL